VTSHASRRAEREADAAGAEAHGRRGEAIDVFRCRKSRCSSCSGMRSGDVWRTGEQADFTNRRFLRPFTLPLSWRAAIMC